MGTTEWKRAMNTEGRTLSGFRFPPSSFLSPRPGGASYSEPARRIPGLSPRPRSSSALHHRKRDEGRGAGISNQYPTANAQHPTGENEEGREEEADTRHLPLGTVLPRPPTLAPFRGRATASPHAGSQDSLPGLAVARPSITGRGAKGGDHNTQQPTPNSQHPTGKNEGGREEEADTRHLPLDTVRGSQHPTTNTRQPTSNGGRRGRPRGRDRHSTPATRNRSPSPPDPRPFPGRVPTPPPIPCRALPAAGGTDRVGITGRGPGEREP